MLRNRYEVISTVGRMLVNYIKVRTNESHLISRASVIELTTRGWDLAVLGFFYTRE